MKKRQIHECRIGSMKPPDKRVASREPEFAGTLKKKGIVEVCTKLKANDLTFLYASRRVS